ncbi:class I SAM-dependent methyltransferase [Marinomonas pollencensis]|uniref:23S rRNA (Cytosine1962-C5)-methyltransferase n=1 Tax=Marinomonas pollencensis TaxID=491954 RepID=A0A3E0DME4_9GAMM|nr:class I SAM-dependent methyltransferase [Marinomonas pollencensis]REG83255.1 23S rRNA (cytosine1962-C5)-methyltransferase [Marinomonas pollencensis]
MQSASLPLLSHHTLTSLSKITTETRRLFHGRGRCFEGLEHITVDWLQGQVLVSLFKQPTDEFLLALKETLKHWPDTEQWQSSECTSLLLQYRYQQSSQIECLWGKHQTQQLIIENGLTYKLDLERNQNSGLFLDMRLGRKWVQENSQNKRVLNLFSYTCGFSVAALAGNAEYVVNLDMAKSVLNRGRENHRLNEHDLSKVSFFGHDIFKSWGKIKKYGAYDLIVIDPPTFQKGSFAITKDYQKILRRLPELLATDGQVLACVNDPTLSSQFLMDGMLAEAPSLRFKSRLENPAEFPDIDPESGLKALIFQS